MTPLPQAPQRGPALPATTPVNALTIDVEDYFQVSAFAPWVARDGWERRECRVERNVDRILALLDDHGTRATFFTLGWIAERHPALVRRIVAGGHELASHGHGHERTGALGPEAFGRDVRRARQVLEQTGGVAVLGYRAPSFSIGAGSLWAFDVLAGAGYTYSSSLYPIRHDHYGMPDAPRFAHRVSAGLLEIPVTTARVARRNLPCGGGGYFRLLPYAASRWLIGRVNRDEGQAAVFYFHPWEIDPGQPRIAGIDPKTRLRHYLNLSRMEDRLRALLRDFRWGRMDHVFPAATPARAAD